MRTTIDLDEDVAAAIARLRRERGVGLSQLVNDLVRKALATEEPRRPFRQRTAPLGLRIDVRNVGEALEILEGPEHR